MECWRRELKILKEGLQMYFSSINYRLYTRINYLLLFNAPYIFNLSRFLKISLLGPSCLNTVYCGHTSPSSHSLAFFPLLLIFLSINPLLLPFLLCVCVCTCRYRAIDHGFYVFMITTPKLNSGDSVCCISPVP